MSEVATSQSRTQSSGFAAQALEIGLAIVFVALAGNNFTLRRDLPGARAGAPAHGAVRSFAPGDSLTAVQAMTRPGVL